ncbi:unnamed protein product [Blepharisma stoltei]|uniref:Uncharacterized protein n=1 Tax=Blepharisma stoltei TaxID=1481888 RepID=A0AAU9JJU8_9CILI|nr:unnamed protein product [Blepharisma stoltei]
MNRTKKISIVLPSVLYKQASELIEIIERDRNNRLEKKFISDPWRDLHPSSSELHSKDKSDISDRNPFIPEALNEAVLDPDDLRGNKCKIMFYRIFCCWKQKMEILPLAGDTKSEEK